MRGCSLALVVALVVALESCGGPGLSVVDEEELLGFDWYRVAAEGPALGDLKPDEREGALLWAMTPPLALDQGGRVPLRLHVPQGTTSFQLLLRGAAGTTVVPVRVVGPDGTVWVDDALEGPDPGDVARALGFPSQLRSPGRVLAKRGTGAWVFPNTPDLPFESGAWEIEAGAFGVVREQGVWTPRPASGAIAAAVVVALGEERVPLPLVVHLAVEGISPASAGEHPVLAPAVARLTEGLAAAGIEMGAPHFVEVLDPSFRTVSLEDDVCSGGDLDDLLETTAGDRQGALHLFVVERFRCVIAGGIDVGESLGGFSPGIPGAGPAVGTAESGVVVAIAFVDDDAALLGQVMLHEVGHYLGLFHTKEASRFDASDLFDIIADTDEDRAHENVMFFSAEGGEELTAGQAQVVRGHPVVLRGTPPPRGEGASP